MDLGVDDAFELCKRFLGFIVRFTLRILRVLHFSKGCFDNVHNGLSATVALSVLVHFRDGLCLDTHPIPFLLHKA